MASPAAPLTLLILLVSLAIAAAQAPSPRGSSTNTFDAAALHAVFKQWNLQRDPAPPAYDPCTKRVWHNSSAMEASINCICSSNDNDCRITHLNVTGFRNITFIPDELFHLTELVSLDLSNNNLSGPITPNIANLTKLEICLFVVGGLTAGVETSNWHFNNNQLRGTFPNGSSSLRNLQSLWMFDNNIDGKVPEFIADFTNLKDLRIYGTKLRGPIPNKFSNMANLTYLMIGDLDGDNFPFDFIGDWANISVLSLRKCGLFGELHHPLPNVTYLDLRSNNLTGPIKQVLQDNRRVQHLYVGENKFNGSLPPQMPPSLLALDVTYNPLLNGSLSNIFSDGRNYIGTSIVSGSNHGEEVSLNCLNMKECNQTVNNTVPFAVNCGGKEYTSDPLQTVFHDDSTDLRSAGFHIDSSNSWVVSHVGADPFSNSTGIVNTTKNISGTDMLELYRTARTSTGSLWYYVVGLTSGRYTVQLFFAEIVIESESGRRLFNIDIQDQNIRADFDIFKEAGGFNKSTNINYTANVTTSVLKIHLYWNGRGTCCIPRNGTYGPLISAIRVFPYTEAQASPPPAPHTSRRDEKRRGVVAGIAALSIAAAVISSSVVYLWWKWVSLVKHRKA